MADTDTGAVPTGSLHLRALRLGPVWVDVNTAYIIYSQSGLDLVYQKTTDGGVTWGSSVTIHDGLAVKASVWYDRWTPGDSGTKIHLAYIDTDSDDVFYASLDTSDDSLSSEVVVFAGASFTNGNWDAGVVDVVRARGGNLYVGFWGNGTGEFGFYRSTDEGDNWTSRAQLADGNAADGMLLMPGDEADDDDIWCIYWDRSANALSIKVYDDSGNSWAETSIATSMTDTNVYIQMSAAPRHRDNHVILVAWSELSAATADLKAWDIGGSGSITALANVVTDLDESAQVAVLINQQNDDIYVAYLKGGTWRATVDVVYKKSTDGGVTWGAEQSYSEAAAADLSALWAGISVGPGGGRFQPIFHHADDFELHVNLNNSVSVFPVLPLRAAYVGASVDSIPSQGSARS
jgi:hypothetical protein